MAHIIPKRVRTRERSSLALRIPKKIAREKEKKEGEMVTTSFTHATPV